MKGFQIGDKMAIGKLKQFSAKDARRWKKEGQREFLMKAKGKTAFK